MARRRQSPAEDLIEIVSKLPWKVGVFLAIASFVILHLVSGIDVQQTVTMENLGERLAKNIYVTLATFGQVIIPFLLLLGSLTSFLRQRKRQRLYQSVEEHTPVIVDQSALQIVESMTWQEFELLVGESFRKRGYTVMETGGGGADGGIDLQMNFKGKKYIVQCKQWKTVKVGVKTVREFFGVLVDVGAAGGFIVTSGVFTDDAIAFANDKQISLIDGAKLLKIINDLKPDYQARLKEVPEAAPPPLCPNCHHVMVKRIAKKGANTGKEFWGCSQFPKCRQVIPI